jgi:hypothetical protein
MSETKKPNRPNQVPWDDDDPNAAIYRHLLWKDARALFIYTDFTRDLITKEEALKGLTKLIP